MTKKPVSSSASPASSRSGFDTKYLHRPLVVNTRQETVKQVRMDEVNQVLNVEESKMSERIYVNEVNRLPSIQKASSPRGAWHDDIDHKSETTMSELPVLDSPSNTESVCSTLVTSGVLESDRTSDWTSRIGTITCDTSDSESDWWERSHDLIVTDRPTSKIRGYYSDDDEESVVNVRLNLEHEDLPDDELRQHRLQQHLQAVDKTRNHRGEFVERVVTATGRRVGKNLDPSYVKQENKSAQRKIQGRNKNIKEKRRRGIKLFSPSDIDSDDEEDDPRQGRSRDGGNNKRWDEVSITVCW